LSKVSPMSDEFHDWLDQCPVMWFRGEVTRDHVTYSFETPDEEDELEHINLKEKYASLEPDLNDEDIEEEARLKDGDDEVSWSK